MEPLDQQGNTSGQGKDSVVPPEIQRWNWGAFLMNWIWGIGNSTYIALLMFVPLVNFVMIFVLGAKGSEWAWRNRIWRDVEHFKRTQRKWAWSGLIIIFVLFPACVSSPFLMMKHNDAYQLSLKEIQNNEQLKDILGEPIKDGVMVSGEIHYNTKGGWADLHFSVSGPKSEGTANVQAIIRDGVWQLSNVVVDVPSQNQRIDVMTQKKINGVI